MNDNESAERNQASEQRETRLSNCLYTLLWSWCSSLFFLQCIFFSHFVFFFVFLVTQARGLASGVLVVFKKKHMGIHYLALLGEKKQHSAFASLTIFCSFLYFKEKGRQRQIGVGGRHWWYRVWVDRRRFGRVGSGKEAGWQARRHPFLFVPVPVVVLYMCLRSEINQFTPIWLLIPLL